ncbi:MAG: sodium:calcium antiporter [Chloroflexota bacterium]|nr:calcium/sodium antiporter [Ardenticatenaceae bacterium]GIK58423.1 MAG: sodium:calcium antiporter [Chloroflexota bacterium]
MIILNIAIIIICVIVLAYGANILVESAARIARRIGLSELVIGLTIVAMGTSAPEFAVTIAAALQGESDISVGNVVGSNIFNLGFILGSVVAVRAIATSPKLVYRDGMMLIGTTLLLLFFMRDFHLQPYEGALLFLGLIIYLFYLFRQREVPTDEIPEGEFRKRDPFLFLVGLTLILAGGHYLVESAVLVAEYFGLSEWAIGVTIVAAGTSAPEFATSLVAVLRGHSDISIGNLIGSDLFNLLGVLGLAGMIQQEPMVIDPAGLNSIMLLSGMVIFVVILMRSGWRLARWEGALLLIINLFRWYFDLTSH